MPSAGGIPHLCFWGQSPSSGMLIGVSYHRIYMRYDDNSHTYYLTARSSLFRSSIDWCPNQSDAGQTRPVRCPTTGSLQLFNAQPSHLPTLKALDRLASA